MNSGGRWYQARDALAAVAEGSPRFDDDGVDLYFLNSDRFQKNVRTRNEVVHLFNSVKPDGGTPTGTRLNHVLAEYIPLVERRTRLQSSSGIPAKPVSIIVITDGDATDDVETVIVQAAKRLHLAQVPEHMLGIQFVQIGNDAEATLALQKLDRSLHTQYGIRDMVDTTPYNPLEPDLTDDVIFKIVLGGLDRKVDRIDEQLRLTTLISL
ncbi:hypothetical protein L218DRAFT_880969 [Marasmius fiardii PR-910]|nr:hypothetical protein L218DRAFT_880969 [Marasmius fiardii PR-910]